MIDGKEVALTSGGDKPAALARIKRTLQGLNEMLIAEARHDLDRLELIEFVSDESAGFPTKH